MGGRQSEPLSFQQQTKYHRGRTTLTTRPNQLSRDLLTTIIPYLRTLPNILLFAQINKKCASSILFCRHNPFFSTHSLLAELGVFTGSKTFRMDLQSAIQLAENNSQKRSTSEITQNLREVFLFLGLFFQEKHFF